MRQIPMILLLCGIGHLFAANPPPAPTTLINLWPSTPPGMVEGATPGADDGTGRYRNVGIPGMLVYLPETPAPQGGRMAIIVCPGGGYTHLTRLEGADGAVEAFDLKNVAILSLKYRTRPPSTNVDDDALADGLRAVRLTRYHAGEWNLDPHKIGLLGWSAGANLTLNVASHFDRGNPDATDPVDRESSRPDFVVMLSPWPSGHEATAYPISRDAPPAFIGSAEDDHTAPVTFARAVGAAYESAGVSHQLWVVQNGGHGAFTINAPGEGGQWLDRFWPWVNALNSSQ